MFSSLFIQTIVEVHRNNARKQRLFFLVYICRILSFIELEHFPSSKLVHLTAPIRATFLKQCNAQRKPTKPSVGTTKRQREEPSHEDVPIDPTTAVDVDVATDADGPSTASHSLRFMLERVLKMQSSQHIMMETFMTTQVAHGQLLDDLISNVAALTVDFIELGVLFHHLYPRMIDNCLWQYVTKGETSCVSSCT